MEGNLIIESPLPQIVKVSINRPSSLNSLNSQVLNEVDQLLTTLIKQDQDPKHRVKLLVLTGGGEKAFVAGADIKEFQEFSERDLENYLSLANRVMGKISEFPAPSVAAVNGYCLGGGLEIALACDFIVASKKSVFGFPEVNLGLIPGFGGTQRALRRLSSARLKELIYLGKKIDTNRAVEIGLIDQVFGDELYNESLTTFMNQFVDLPQLSVRAAKESIHTQLNGFESMGLKKEEDFFKRVFLSKDGIEGRSAFCENRKPNFKGE